VVLANHVGVERQELRLVGNAILELTKAGHDTCAVSFLVTVLVEAHAEFDCKPVQGSESLELNLGSTKRCQAYFLGKVSKVLMSKHGGMTDQFVDNIWLRSVFGVAVVAYVLGRVEHLKSKSIQELSLCKKTTNWLKSPSRLFLQE